MSLFGRNRDDRRRRAIAEELAGEVLPAPFVSPSASKAEKTQRYTAAAKRENHKRATDYLPRGRISLAGWYFAGLLCVAGLLLAYLNAASEKIAALGLTSLFDASQGGSLAGWFSSFLFGLAAMASVLIYSVRRHKLDDYRGRYRLWLWCAAAWVVMSIDATANLHAPLSRAMAKATGWSMLPEGAIWWIGLWGIVITILALRLLFEVRQCRMAMLAIFGVAGLWSASLAIEFGWIPVREYGAVIATGCRLAGQVTLLASIAVYARHVLLDAEGLLKIRQQKAKKENPVRKAKAAETQSSTVSSSSAAQSYRTDTAHKAAEKRTDLQPGAPSRGTSGYATSASSTGSSLSSNRNQNDDEEDDRYSGYEDEDDDSTYGNRKLSKAERKKIRKQMRRQQREEGYDDDR